MAESATAAPPPPAAAKPRERKLRWGDVNWAAFFHTGATVDGALIVKGAGEEPDPQVVVERDEPVAPGADPAERRVEELPASHLDPVNAKGRRVRTLVNSASPLVPSGTKSTDPSLLVVPYGRLFGLMLGQLSAEEKAEVASTATTERIRNALKAAAFWPESHANRPALREPGPKRNASPRVRIGQVDLALFYHKGAVIQNLAGANLLVVEGWGLLHKGKPAARVVLCDEAGVPLPDARETMLVSLPATRLAPSKDPGWKGVVKLLKSENPQLVAGTLSTDPALLLATFGFHEGKALGSLTTRHRADFSERVRVKGYKDAILEAKNFAGVADTPERKRLSDAALRQVRADQDRLLKSIPLVSVIEQFCGLAPDEISGPYRKYRVGEGIINVNARTNQFGSLNGYKFKNLRDKEGSSNNAMDMAIAVYELEGRPIQYGKIAKEMAAHFDLEGQMNEIFESARRREAAIAEGKPVEPLPEPRLRIEAELKAAAAQRAVDEQEHLFDLRRGQPANVEGERYGGGFLEDESLWPKARAYLVEERKLDPALVDHLHEHRNLFASWRSDPSAPEIIVAPVFGFKTGQCVAVDTKPLPQKPGEKTLGKCYGPVGKGAFMFGIFNDDTRRVVFCEGWIKAIAYYELHRLADEIGHETCIMSLAGAKAPIELIPRLKELGAKAVVAFDNEFAGREAARTFSTECAKQGVPCEERFVTPSEVTFSVLSEEMPGYSDAARAEAIHNKVITWAEENKVPFRRETDTTSAKELAVRLPNTEAVINFLETLIKEDRIAANKDYQARAGALRARLVNEGVGARQIDRRIDHEVPKRRITHLAIHHKDWDDVKRKGPLKPTLGAPVPQSPVAGVTPLPPESPAPAAEVEAPQTPPMEHPTTVEAHPPRGERLTPALILVRTAPGKGAEYLVGTALGIHHLQVTKEQAVLLGMLVDEGNPRAALISGHPPKLAGYMNQDGLMVDAVGVLDSAHLSEAPEVVLRSWLNPTKGANIEHLTRLRRASGLPVPPPSPASPSQKPSAAIPELKV